MEMLIFFAVIVIWVWGRLGDRAAALLLYGLAAIALSLLFGVLTGELAAMLILPAVIAVALAAKLVMRGLERGRPPAS